MNAATLEAPAATTTLRTTREIASEAPARGTDVQWSQQQQHHAEQLVEEGTCATLSDARFYVTGEAILAAGGKLPPDQAAYCAATREIIAGGEALRAKRTAVQRWHARLHELEQSAARAARRWQWEADRLAALATEDSAVESYLVNIAGNEHLGEAAGLDFAGHNLRARELARILAKVVPELQRRADAAQAAAVAFAKTSPTP